MDITYIGHSAFQIKTDKGSILIDPYVQINPKYNWREREFTDIFVTHGHSDHLGNAIEISKEKNVPITAVVEVASYCSNEGAIAKGVNLGGWIEYPWGRAIFVPAYHSSSLPNKEYGGVAAGIILDIEGVRIYHAGDTALTGEMKTIKELYHPILAMLPIGGHYTMDAEHAAVAADWLGVKTVIPMHYNTFPEIKTDLEKFLNYINMCNTNCLILNPDEIPNN